MKISFITTIFNEAGTITNFLESLLFQTLLPDEIIIVDGGSTDKTVSLIHEFNFPVAKNKVKILIKKGNRSIGRNEAIRHATCDVIICSDAGNVLDKDWIKKITEPFHDRKVDVVAGYYKGLAQNTFQKSLIPYVLVMPDRVNPHDFLPATRSVAFRKAIWEKVGGFDEKLSHNEDYAFAKNLKKSGANIVFAKDAIVYWIPRSTLKQTYVMFLRFAYGDAEARIFRPKVLLIFLRYLVIISLFFLYSSSCNGIYLITIVLFFFAYIIWATMKNYRYVEDPSAFFFLPFLQFIADIGVMHGTISGLLGLWDTKKMS